MSIFTPVSSQNSNQRRHVLSEEEYTATLTSIVQRDYFPDLPKLERQAALLERRERGDVTGAVAVRRAARSLVEHEEALEAEEGDEQDLCDGEIMIRRRARPIHQESITGFHARATNEDDEEFYSQQKKEVQANRERLEKLFLPDGDSDRPRLITMASDGFMPESNRIAAHEWNQPKVRNGLFFSPTPLRNNFKQEAEVKMISNGKDDDNSMPSQMTLMPPPDRLFRTGIGLKYKSSGVPKYSLVEYVPKHALEKMIEPSRTRFPNNILPVQSHRVLASATADLESQTDGSMTDASTDLDAPLRPIDQERQRRLRKQEQSQQSYIAMTPLIVPGTGNESPIMTWGTVDSTPIIISVQEQEGVQPSPFSLSTETARERAARKAELELARRAKRAKSSSKGTVSHISSSNSLLEKRKLTLSRDAFTSALRSSYTPKVRSASGTSKRRVGDSAYNATPLASRFNREK